MTERHKPRFDCPRSKRTAGEVIARVREQRGLSQKQVAKAMNCPRTFVSKVENDKTLPTLATLERFAIALKTTPWDLVRCMYSHGAPVEGEVRE